MHCFVLFLKSGSDKDVAKAVAYGKRIKLYPLSQAANPQPTISVDAIDSVFDATIPYDLRLYQSLDRVVQHEPWLTRDKAMIDQLKSIGIEKANNLSQIRRTGQYFWTRRARSTIGSTCDTRQCFHLLTMKALRGRCQSCMKL